MGLHKITAGSGYDYLTRQVAALDATEKGHTGLASYYTERGESPGQWLGSGMAGIDGLNAGDPVTAEQMQALFGSGHHPLAHQRQAALAGPEHSDRDRAMAARLGAPFKVYPGDVSPFRREVAGRLAAWNRAAGRPDGAPVPASERARVRTEVGREFFLADFGRPPLDARELAGHIARLSRQQTTAVAGFDLTFSPVKSVSALWALADPHTAAVIEQAHRAAISDALAMIEQRALFTRTGANGVRQVDVQGLVAAAFTHRDSRAGDPDLHTHVAVANKVQTLDGGWLSIDGRVLYKAKVTASETYNTALERHLAHSLGVQFVDRATEDGRRPVREIEGVDPALLQHWSSRRISITTRQGELSVEFQRAHGRPPTPVEALALAQQATLETREAKHEPRLLAEQRTTWRTQAESVLGGRGAVASMMHRALHPTPRRTSAIDGEWIDDSSSRIVTTIEQRRSTWQSWHVRAEALRHARTHYVPLDQLDAVVGQLVDAALSRHSLPLRNPDDTLVEPDVLRRLDGASVYTVSGTQLFTSARILAAEQRLVDAAGRRDGMTVDATAIDFTLLESTANGLTLNAGQVALVRAMATSGSRVQLAIAPAGSGKTTAMRALTAAWTEAGGTVIGLAPSAAAAAALGEQIDSHTDTLAKLTWSLGNDERPEWVTAIGPKTLVIIDEAGMADTLSLDAAVDHILARGGSVRLIGDDQQLAAIGAGGVLRDIATTHGAVRLNELVRFTDPAEGAASLALRDGHPEALGFYLDRGRVHVGDLATITDDVFASWLADRNQGRDAIMLAPTRELVAELNQRARAHRLGNQPTGHEVDLADGNRASAGDVIITRTNNRRLATSPTDWVKNGDRWTILATRADGGVRAIHNQNRLAVDLPTDYVRASVELGYATTVHSAQGVSVDTMHGIATDALTRQQLYTMLTRGRHANHVHLQVVGDGEPHTAIRPETVLPPTPTDLLEQILARDELPVSATTQQRDLLTPTLRLGPATARYTDALHVAAEATADPETVHHLAGAAERVVPGVTNAPAWPTLRAHLLLLAASGAGPVAELDRAAEGLGAVDDPAAVLDWRLDPSGLRSAGTGPLPWIPGIPATLAEHPTWGPYLSQRRQLVTDLATQVRDSARDGATPAWVTARGTGLPAEAIADIEVWRAAMNVAPTDLRPTGQRRLGVAAWRWQRRLDRLVSAGISPAMDEWGPLLHSLAPGMAADEFTPELARRLAQISSAGLDARSLLRDAAAEGVLPDDHAAAALWWRIARHISPATAPSADTDPPVDSAWTRTLGQHIGEASARKLQASPWWPALVTVVDRAVQRGWAPADLLTEPPAGVTDVDPCQALVWRTSLLIHPLRGEAEPDPDTPPHDLWDGYHPDPVAEWLPLDAPAPAGRDAGLEVEVEDVDDLTLDDDPGPDFTIEAMIRNALPAPEPTEADMRAMFARADAWRDSGTTPERLTQINHWANEFYQQQYAGSWAQHYLFQRFGVDLTGDPHYQPGYAPNTWTALTSHLRRRGVSDHELQIAGLALPASTGRLIDRFRDRVLFPIIHDGHVLGFVGRRHPERTDSDKAGPKYLNTPETPLFHKGAQLYAAEGLISAGATPVIVEGPMDAIAITLATGGSHVGVAPLGTSLTDEQAAQLAGWRRQPIVATDADLAGQIAAERDYWILTHHRMDPSHAQLPAGSDPADLLAIGDRHVLAAAIRGTRPLADALITERLTGPRDINAALNAVRVLAAQPPDAWEPGANRIAGQAGIPFGLIRHALCDAIRAINQSPRAATEAGLRETFAIKKALAQRRIPNVTNPGKWLTDTPTIARRAGESRGQAADNDHIQAQRHARTDIPRQAR